MGTASSNIGCNGTDVTDNDGAAPLSGGYIVTVSNNITADILKKISGDISPYYKYAKSETVTLSYYNLPEGYTLVYTVEGAGTVQVNDNAFEMPAANVTVSGICIYKGGIDLADCYAGLFGSIGSNGMVKNVTLSDARITGFHWVGGIVGRSVSGTIENCHVTSSVVLNAVQDYAQCFGGIAGEITEASASSSHAYILDCTSSVTITMANENFANCVKFGGIVGNIKDAGIIEDCLAIGANIHVSVKSQANQGGAILGDCNNQTNMNLKLINNYYCGCTLNGSTSDIGFKNNDIIGGAEEAVLLSETQTSMPTAVSTEMVFRRSFTKDVASTICLPFGIDATQAAAAGKFYTFLGVDKSDPDNWEVIMYEDNKAPGTLDANTAYLFVPNATGHVLFHGSAPSTIEAGNAVNAGWTFQGTYARINWTTDPQTVYGFAAPGKADLAEGKFFRVKGGQNSYVLPFRAYLDAAGGGASTRGGNAPVASGLPDVMNVRLIDFGEETGIKRIANPASDPSPSGAGSKGWYSIDGRRLSVKPSAKGIYIHDGKKVVIK